MANIKARVLQGNQIRAKQVAIGNSASLTADLTSKSINELADVSATETDKGVLQYNASTDKWETTNVLDGGTF
jgi:hypothetical protein